MTNSLGSALPGFAAPRTQPTAPAKQDDSGFGKLLDAEPAMAGTEPAIDQRPSGRRASSHPGGQAGFGDKAEEGRTGVRMGQVNGVASKNGGSELSAKPHKHVGHREEAAPGHEDLPLQDRIPLLVALHDLRRSSTRDDLEEGSGVTGADAPAPAGSEAAARSKRPAVAHEIASDGPRPDRTSLIGRPLAELGRLAAKLGSDASTPPRHDAISRNEPFTGAPAEDVPGTQPTRPDPAVTVTQGARPSVGSDTERPPVQGGKIDIVAERSFPVPPQAALSQAALNVIDAVAAGSGTHGAASASSAASGPISPGAAPTHTLKIELHPAELGMVTASHRLSGEQLSIELKPETEDAYRRLSSDSEAIVKSLRGLGFDVDKVTIMQPQIAVLSSTRADAAAALPAPARDPSSFQPGNPGGNGGAGGQQPGRQSSGNQNDDAHGRSTAPSRERAGDAVFI
jgi:chemotaxis protein MotD